MKRRSGLSIIAIGMMVVLLFLVLSAATYAWYSASNVVQTDSFSFTSSAPEDGLLTIGASSAPVDSTITFDTPDALSPMIPVLNGLPGETKLSDFLLFHRTYEEMNFAGQWVAQLDGMETHPTLLSLEGQEWFYVKNNAATPLEVRLEYKIEGYLNDKLHGALFLGEAEDETLLGIISGSGAVHYGAINAGELVENKPLMDAAYRPSGEITFMIAAGQSVRLSLAIWLDGVTMKDDDGDRNTIFSLTFVVNEED